MKAGKDRPRLFPKPLGIVKVIAPLDQTREVIKAVETAGYVQPIDVDPRPGINQMEIEQRRVTFENYRSELQSLINNVKDYIVKPKKKLEVPGSQEGAEGFVKEILETEGKRIKELIEQKEVHNKRIGELKDLKRLLLQFQNLGLDTSLLRYQEKYTRIFVGSIFKDQLESLNSYLLEITDGRYVLINNDPKKADKSGNVEFMAIVFADDAEAVEVRLKELNYEPIRLPEDRNLSSKLDVSDVEQEIKEEKAKIAQLDSEEGGLIQKEATENGYKLLAALEVCNVELQRIEVEFKMRRTKNTSVMWGWIPPEKFDQFKSLVTTFTGGSAVLEFKETFDRKFMPSYTEDKPQKLFPPVRGLVTSFGTPSPKEIDPYVFVGIGFILFFAIMFGDVGHGFLLMMIGFWARNKRKKMDEIPSDGIGAYLYGGANLMIWMGFASMIAGLFLGSLFGDETILWEVPVLETIFSGVWRFFYTIEEVTHDGHTIVELERNYLKFLIFSFGVGAGVILLGLFLKVYQQIYYRHTNFEMYATLSLITLYVSGILALVTGSVFFIVLIVLALVGVLFFEGKAHGFDGAMEGVDHILALLSNTFSFGRLLAMNTVHFVLAFLPYLFFDLFGGTHTINHEPGHWVENVVESGSLIPWIISALIGAVLVLIVEVVFSTLQALRLTWVEFFGKFYKGEGIPFEPIKVHRILTVE